MSDNGSVRVVATWAGSAFVTIIVIYQIALVSMMVAELPFPPQEPYLTLFNVLNLAAPAAAIPLWCAIHVAAPPGKQVYTLMSLVFIVMFAVVVMIDRFVALTLVPQSEALGMTAGLEWFRTYNWPSLTFALEMLGWGLFFSIACLLVVPVFSAGGVERWIAGAFGLSGLLSLGGIVGLFTGSVEVMGAVAPVAWGVGPMLGIVLLVVRLRRPEPTGTRSPDELLAVTT